MKQLYPLLLALLFALPIVAQKNTVALDLRILPACGYTVAGGSLNYYRATDERHAFGFKTTLNTDALGLEELETRTHVVNFDITNRWRLSEKSKIHWFAEAGISGLWTIERTPPQPKSTLGWCSTGMTDEEIRIQSEYLADYYSKWHTKSEFMPGITTATSVEFILTRQFALGAVLMANLYYSPTDDCFYPYLVPGVRTAFNF